MPQQTTDVFIALLVVLGSTATIVSASNSRQENLSARTRSLSHDFRTLAMKNPKNPLERERLCRILEQIILFKGRVGLCVWGHIALYTALILELLGFGTGLLGHFSRSYLEQKHLGRIAQGTTLLASGLLILGSLALLAGMGFHLAEYLQSKKTMETELGDILSYSRSHSTMDGGVYCFDTEAFLKRVHTPMDDIGGPKGPPMSDRL